MKKILLCLLAVLVLLAGCQNQATPEPVEPEPAVVDPTDDDGLTLPEIGGQDSAGDMSYAIGHGAVKPDEEAEAPRLTFTTQDLALNAVDDSVFAQADLTMLNIWATYCTPCLAEMPELAELAEEYAERGLQIVGVVVDVVDEYGNYQDDQIELAEEIIAQTGADYLHLLPSMDLIYNLLSGISVVPTTIFFDSEGHVVGSIVIGSRDKDGWMEIFDMFLELV